jgi:hypothetical protein
LVFFTVKISAARKGRPTEANEVNEEAKTFPIFVPSVSFCGNGLPGFGDLPGVAAKKCGAVARRKKGA